MHLESILNTVNENVFNVHYVPCFILFIIKHRVRLKMTLISAIHLSLGLPFIVLQILKCMPKFQRSSQRLNYIEIELFLYNMQR